MIKARRQGRPHIVQPVFADQPGHPVGFSNEFFGEQLLAQSGDVGARRVVAAHPASLELVEVDDRGVIDDIDVPP